MYYTPDPLQHLKDSIDDILSSDDKEIMWHIIRTRILSDICPRSIKQLIQLFADITSERRYCYLTNAINELIGESVTNESSLTHTSYTKDNVEQSSINSIFRTLIKRSKDGLIDRYMLTHIRMRLYDKYQLPLDEKYLPYASVIRFIGIG